MAPENNFPAFVSWKAKLGKLKSKLVGMETIGFDSQTFLFNYFPLIRTMIIGIVLNL
jgi:hypothetical protein